MRIDEFLLARIAEDEAAAWVASRHNDPAAYAKDNYGCLLVDPARVVAECAAKRAIVADHAVVDYGGLWGCERCGVDVGTTWVRPVWPCTTMLALAAIYADHPDYRDEWRAG